MIQLDIVSDPICPWCYIGKARLDAALAAREENPFDIRWRAFQLNPDMPPEGMDRAAYLEAKFGARNATRFYARIAEEARASGLSVDFDRIARTPNTVDAHRLIRWARAESVQQAVVDVLFRAYFAEGRDISDREVLADVAQAAGMERPLVLRLLASDADIAEIREEDRRAREMGVTGVPTFILDGRHVVQGAQDAGVWGRVLDELAAVPT